MATALITGGAVRLGKAMALHLAQQGMNIVFTYNSSQNEAFKTLHELHSFGIRAKAEHLNAEDVSAVSPFMQRLSEEFNDLSLLINSASVFPFKGIEQSSDTLMKNIFSVNLMTPLAFMREFYHLSAGKEEERQIINILDQRILKNLPSHALYSVSKAALAHATTVAAVEFGGRIRVNGIAPGLVLPPPGKDERFLNRMSRKIPLGRRGKPEHILAALDYLLNNTFVHGEILYVDGGESKGERYDETARA